jgi:hypothetical protein
LKRVVFRIGTTKIGTFLSSTKFKYSKRPIVQ